MSLPYILSPHLQKLLKSLQDSNVEAYAALAKQFIPSENENNCTTEELADPLGAEQHAVSKRLIHQYKNRCLLLVTDKCLSYCRYCFRRNFIEQANTSFISQVELDQVCTYIRNHPEIDEVLISGGDIMTGSDVQIINLLESLRSVRSSLLLRLCTRANVFAPKRFTPQLIAKFKQLRPLWLIPHINHPAELSLETTESFCNFIDSGIPIQSQTVLLRGVNDSPKILATLFNQLVKLGVKPGYIFQADLAKGTSHFRVPVQEGLRIYDDLRELVSGLSLPIYAVDLPGGGGKFNMLQMDPSILRQKSKSADTVYEVEKNGSTWYYPKQ